MTEILGVPIQAFAGQLVLGLVNGSFYALLSLGLALIFGMLGIINFAHGAFYMMGAMISWMCLHYLDLGYWWSLLLAPIAVAVVGGAIEVTMLRRLYALDPLYGLLLTFGVSLILEGAFRHVYGVSGQPYSIPDEFAGAYDLGFMFLPRYRGWVIAASLGMCCATWYLVERTRLGANLRAAAENPALAQALGINVPRMISLTYAVGVALAAFGGVLAAPVLHLNPLMGSNLMIVVFAVVVIGGMGSLLGAIVTGVFLGLAEGLAKVFYPEVANTIVFAIMAVVLLMRPAGLFGRERR